MGAVRRRRRKQERSHLLPCSHRQLSGQDLQKQRQLPLLPLFPQRGLPWQGLLLHQHQQRQQQQQQQHPGKCQPLQNEKPVLHPLPREGVAGVQHGEAG